MGQNHSVFSELEFTLLVKEKDDRLLGTSPLWSDGREIIVSSNVLASCKLNQELKISHFLWILENLLFCLSIFARSCILIMFFLLIPGSSCDPVLLSAKKKNFSRLKNPAS